MLKNPELSQMSRKKRRRRAGFGPEAVCSWWRDQFSADQGVVAQPEILLSNWFTVEGLPSQLNAHVLRPQHAGPVDFDGTSFPHPAVWINGEDYVTFRPEEFRIARSTVYSFSRRGQIIDPLKLEIGDLRPGFSSDSDLRQKIGVQCDSAPDLFW